MAYDANDQAWEQRQQRLERQAEMIRSHRRAAANDRLEKVKVGVGHYRRNNDHHTLCGCYVPARALPWTGEVECPGCLRKAV